METCIFNGRSRDAAETAASSKQNAQRQPEHTSSARMAQHREETSEELKNLVTQRRSGSNVCGRRTKTERTQPKAAWRRIRMLSPARSNTQIEMLVETQVGVGRLTDHQTGQELKSEAEQNCGTEVPEPFVDGRAIALEAPTKLAECCKELAGGESHVGCLRHRANARRR